jgi:HTH-type transcriptional regulator / antitoxin MqsA
MINKTLCPICEEGDLSTHTDMVEYITLEGVAILIPLVYSVCNVCGSEQAGTEQTAINKRVYEKLMGLEDMKLKGKQYE